VTSAFPPPTRDRGRADACPGALRPHAADDGALFRIRVPGGLLTVDQTYVLAALAEELGDGRLDLTSRGNVQLRGLAADSGGVLAERLFAAGLLPSLRHERARNVVASPLSGTDGAGHADTAAWTRELDRLLCASEAAAGLSGRFLFALDDGRGDVAVLGADVTVLARADGRAELRLGGGTAPLLVPAADAPRRALRAAEAFLALAARGAAQVWRIADLGPDARADLRESLSREFGTAEPSPAPVAVPTPTPTPTPESQAQVAGRGPALGVLTGGGRAAVSVAARLGRVSAAGWRAMAAVAADGSGQVRLTPWRGVVVPGLAPERAPRALSALAAASFVTRADSPWHGATACTGRPGCAKSLADVRADATAALTGAQAEPQTVRPRPALPRPAAETVVRPAAETVVRPGPSVTPAADASVPPAADRLLPVHWSGCERRCGRPGGGDWVDVVALADGYRITAHGVTSRLPPDQAPAALAAARRTPSTETK
jgi:precorrin-3B synthase